MTYIKTSPLLFSVLLADGISGGLVGIEPFLVQFPKFLGDFLPFRMETVASLSVAT
jgi:hypothetical protein